MPLHTNKWLNAHARLVIWEIGETPDWFLSQLRLDEEERQRYEGFRTDLRRVHWLAYRHILKNLVGKGSDIRVRYDKHNKPFIDLSEDHISVSHSGRYAAVIISHNHAVGIDIEQISPRLHRIADRFLSPEETGREVGELSTGELCLHWCAKEALYKLKGERNLDFRENIRVIGPPEGMHGPFEGLIRSRGVTSRYLLHSDVIDDYCLVYAVDTAAG